MAELLACLPPDLVELNPRKAWRSLGISLALSLLAYGLVTGTVAGGCWVIAHECGHHAFHPNWGYPGFVDRSIGVTP